jgi:hypothetical protein
VKQTTTDKARSFWNSGVASRTSSIMLTKGSPWPAEQLTWTTPGLRYAYYEGQWEQLPDFASLTPVKSGEAAGVNIESLKGRENGWGLVYSGYIDISLDGLYTFFVYSDDGSKLYLGDSLVVSNDGLHGSMEKSGEVLLKAGKHRLKLLYFDASGGESLVVSYSGPGIRKQEVPAPAYSH